jgi:hypothetical protein
MARSSGRTCHAGGVAASSAALLAQTYRVPALGALGITAALAAVALGLRRLLHTMQADKLRDLAWAPAILALAIFNQYDDPLSILLRIGTSIWTAVLYRSIPLKAPAARVGTFLVLFSLTYHLVGATALLTACVVCLAEVPRIAESSWGFLRPSSPAVSPISSGDSSTGSGPWRSGWSARPGTRHTPWSPPPCRPNWRRLCMLWFQG